MSHAVSRHDGHELKESAVAVKDAVVDLAEESGRYANQRISDAKVSANSMVKMARDKVDDYNDTVITFVRKNPYKSLAMAAGVGLAAGFLLRRR